MEDHLRGLVADLDVPRVREGAVRLLAEVGMSVPSADVRRRVLEAGLELREQRVYLPAEAVSSFMDRQKAEAAEEPDEAPLALHTGSHCLYDISPIDGSIQRLTVAGLERWTKLIGALHAQGRLAAAYCPGSPSDCPPHLAPLWQNLICARYVPQPLIVTYAPEYAPYCAQMHAILERPQGTGAGVHPISPLVLGGAELDLALRLLDEGLATTAGAYPMPVMGVTAPVDWVAAWAQAVAEAVGTAVVLEALGFQRASAMACLYVSDLRHGSFVFGAPEHALITLAEHRVNREILGCSRRIAKGLNTTAKTPGPHAAVEKTAHTLTALLGGYRSLSSLGVLAVDEIFSPQQLVFDLELVEHVWRIVRGVEPAYAAGDVVSLVREGLDGEFLSAETTLNRHRGFFQYGRLLDRRSTAAWLGDPTDEMDRAWSLAEAAIESHDWELPEGKLRELRSVVDDADAHLAP